MNVVFASDSGYVAHLVTAICSLIESNSDENINIYIINTDIDSSSWQKIASLGRGGKQRFIDVKISDEELDGLILNHHFTKANYYRLFAPDKVVGNKALYIDSDVVVVGDVRGLYDTDLHEVYLAAVEEPMFDRHDDLGMKPDAKYFNSGVMLMNLDAWRKDSLMSRVIDFVRNNPDVVKYVDQCGLNAVVNGAWRELNPKFNMQSSFYELSATLRDSVYQPGAMEEAMSDPVIVHYTGSSKPWQLGNKHPYKQLYWKYRSKTPFKRVLYDDISFVSVLKFMMPDFIKRTMKRVITDIKY